MDYHLTANPLTPELQLQCLYFLASVTLQPFTQLTQLQGILKLREAALCGYVTLYNIEVP